MKKELSLALGGLDLPASELKEPQPKSSGLPAGEGMRAQAVALVSLDMPENKITVDTFSRSMNPFMDGCGTAVFVCPWSPTGNAESINHDILRSDNHDKERH
jgi:hypothetical protein